MNTDLKFDVGYNILTDDMKTVEFVLFTFKNGCWHHRFKLTKEDLLELRESIDFALNNSERDLNILSE